MLSKEDTNDNSDFPVYSSESTNNGIIGYTDNPEFICNEETPVYITFGDHTRTVNIAEKSFSVLDNVKVLLPCTNNILALLFMIATWQKQIPNLGYSRHWKVAKDCVLSLPTTANNEIDFDFMESFIRELEEERIRELSAYLTVSGLSDATLTEREKLALQNFDTLEWQEFRYDEIFNHIEQGRRLKKDDQKAGNIPFVMSGVTNKGVVNYISNPVASFPANSLTVDIFGNTFYRSFAYGLGDDTGAYWSDEKEYSKEEMLFFTASIGKSLVGKYSYGHKLRSSQSLGFKMLLPVRNGVPDYEAMQDFISAMQKLVIKDVVSYADDKIAATKELVRE